MKKATEQCPFPITRRGLRDLVEARTQRNVNRLLANPPTFERKVVSS